MKNNILTTGKYNTYLHSKKTSGNDERYEKNETEIHEKMYILQKNFEKKRILDILQNEHVSINCKLELLKDNTLINPPDIKAGGLFNEFDFEFD